MKKILQSLICFTSLTSAINASAIGIVGPENFAFKLTANHQRLDCDAINRALDKYVADSCLDGRSSSACDVDGDLLVIAAGMKSYSAGNLMTFEDVKYTFNSSVDVKNAPTNQRMDFNTAYVLSAYWPGNLNQLKFQGDVKSSALLASKNLSIPMTADISNSDGQRTVTVKNKMLACSLERHQLSLAGRSSVEVSIYHPLDKVRLPIVSSLISKASQLSLSSDSLARKQFALGAAAGNLLRNSNLISSEADFDQVLLSLQTLILKDPDHSLELNTQNSNANEAASFLLNGRGLLQSYVELVF